MVTTHDCEESLNELGLFSKSREGFGQTCWQSCITFGGCKRQARSLAVLFSQERQWS